MQYNSSRIDMAIQENQPPEITPPDIDDPQSLDTWLEKYVTTPDLSFAYPELTNPDGTPWTPQQRLQGTPQQIIMGVEGLKQLKRPRGIIINFVMSSLPTLTDK